MTKKRSLLFTFLSLLLGLLLSACLGVTNEITTPELGGMAMNELPEELDTATTRMTEEGSFQVSVSSDIDPVELNEIHSWTIHVETAGGDPVEGAFIRVEGGMPQHNHGFPTEPEVTEDLGDGDYLLEGMKFSMAGWWELMLAISDGDQTEHVTFNIVMP